MLTDEIITKKKKFAGEKKISMKRRDDHHDYTERRMYMITIEVEGRRPVFGHLTGDPFARHASYCRSSARRCSTSGWPFTAITRK